jgi:hypothetical protein
MGEWATTCRDRRVGARRPDGRLPHGEAQDPGAPVVSCNAHFAQLALGPRPLLDAASLFQMDVAQPATAACLQRTLAQAGYGQGQVLVSPVKMARLASSIARGGVVPQIRWIDASEPEPAPGPRFLSAADAATLSRYMREVVTSGTARTLQSNPTAIAGKTGTAEVANEKAHSGSRALPPATARTDRLCGRRRTPATARGRRRRSPAISCPAPAVLDVQVRRRSNVAGRLAQSAAAAGRLKRFFDQPLSPDATPLEPRGRARRPERRGNRSVICRVPSLQPPRASRASIAGARSRVQRF